MMVKNLIEHEDGSATVEFDMTQQEVMEVMEIALRIGLIKGLRLAEAEEMKGFKDERNK